MKSPEEILQCFDEQKNPTEGQPRTAVKTKPYKYWSGVSNIWVVNNNGQLLCSRRSINTENPNKWQTYFGGHVTEGLSFKQTAVKELREEIGIFTTENDLHLINTGTYPDQKKFFESFVVSYNEPHVKLANTDGEITETRWIEMDKYWKEKEANPDNWCNSCRPEQQKSISEWLTKH